jgi:hypothetical protein
VSSTQPKALQRANRKAAAEEAARQGHYVATDDARQEMGRIAGAMQAEADGALREIATIIAAKFDLPLRDVSFEMTQAQHGLRGETIVVDRQP